MKKLSPRILLLLALLTQIPMFLFPVMKTSSKSLYMSENIVLQLSVGLPMVFILVNFLAKSGKNSIHLILSRVTMVLLFLLMALLLFSYFEQVGHRLITLMPCYFLPAVTLALNSLAMGKWKT